MLVVNKNENISYHLFQVYKHIREACKNSVGMPLAVQVVGRRYNEELILKLMKEIESISKFEKIR